MKALAVAAAAGQESKISGGGLRFPAVCFSATAMASITIDGRRYDADMLTEAARQQVMNLTDG